MLVRLEKTKGSEAESEINPPASKNATMVLASSFKMRILASKMGVKMSTAPSLAKKAEMMEPKSSE